MLRNDRRSSEINARGLWHAIRFNLRSVFIHGNEIMTRSRSVRLFVDRQRTSLALALALVVYILDSLRSASYVWTLAVVIFAPGVPIWLF